LKNALARRASQARSERWREAATDAQSVDLAPTDRRVRQRVSGEVVGQHPVVVDEAPDEATLADQELREVRADCARSDEDRAAGVGALPAGELGRPVRVKSDVHLGDLDERLRQSGLVDGALRERPRVARGGDVGGCLDQHAQRDSDLADTSLGDEGADVGRLALFAAGTDHWHLDDDGELRSEAVSVFLRCTRPPADARAQVAKEMQVTTFEEGG
jgi:hypothetical protein